MDWTVLLFVTWTVLLFVTVIAIDAIHPLR